MIIVITGATKGIGRAIARNLADKGHHLALCARTITDLEDFKDELLTQTRCGKIMIRSLDVRSRSSLKLFGEDVLREFGYIDVLINNTGIFIPGKFADESSDAYDRTLETNVHAPYFLTKVFLPSMIAREEGHIINLCSVSSVQPNSNGVSYAMSKHALLGFGKSLREEVREYGIRVTNILPGPTWSSSWEGIDHPEDRLINARNVARVVATSIELDENVVMEEVIIRPVKGDLN